jgi:molybdenum cofactor synthesis domain-containing protein
VRTAAAIVIGNEILSGKIVEANLHGLARMLRGVGFQLRRVVVILDELDTIAHEVRSLSAQHDVVFTSGGVGPTHDDLTVEGVARAFGVRVHMSPPIEDLLRSYYGEKLTDGHLLMARIPEGARLVTGPKSPWPTVVMRNVWMLPGVPQIFASKLPIIEEELRGDPPIVSVAVFTTQDEGQLKAVLDSVVAAYPDIDIGSYPVWDQPDYKTKLTFDGTDASRAKAARDQFAAGLPKESIVRLTD